MSSRARRRALAAPGMRARLIAVLAVLVVLTGLVGSSLAFGGSDSRLMLRATFKDASPLLVGNDVRLAGVRVGRIASMRTTGAGADVTIELDKEALPVHTDARLTIRPVSLLGERYVELDRGSADAPVLPDGGHLGITQTGSSVDLDQVLNSLDDPTAQALATLVGTLGDGMDGNGRQVARTIEALAPVLDDSRGVTTTLRDQTAVLNQLVSSLERVASGLATGEGHQLDHLVAVATSLLETTGSNDAAFRDMLAELPATLEQAERTLGILQGTAGSAEPTLRALRPTTRNLSRISEELKAFADAADPALVSADPVLRKADALLDQARPVAALLRQQAPAITADAAALDPLTRRLAGDFTAVMEFFKGWALATNSRDGLSHYFRAGLVVSPYSATGLLPGSPSVPETPAADPGPDSPTGPLDQGGDAPLLQNGVGGLLNGILGGSLLSPRTDRGGGVTGLTRRQESGALDFLLGGN